MIFEDSILIQRAQNGDILAFAHLHDRYYPCIYRFFYYRLLNAKDAEEWSSILFRKVVEKIGFYKSNKGSFLPWLYTLAQSLLGKYELENKKDGKEVQQPQKEDQQPPQTTYLKNALAHLSPDERELIIQRLIERRPLHAAARDINHSMIAARQLQHAALQDLQRALDEDNCLDKS